MYDDLLGPTKEKKGSFSGVDSIEDQKPTKKRPRKKTSLRKDPGMKYDEPELCDCGDCEEVKSPNGPIADDENDEDLNDLDFDDICDDCSQPFDECSCEDLWDTSKGGSASKSSNSSYINMIPKKVKIFGIPQKVEVKSSNIKYINLIPKKIIKGMICLTDVQAVKKVK